MGKGKSRVAHHLRAAQVDLDIGRERGKQPYYNEQGDFAGWVFEGKGSRLVLRLASRTWRDVTAGTGVVLADGKEVPPEVPKGGRS